MTSQTVALEVRPTPEGRAASRYGRWLALAVTAVGLVIAAEAHLSRDGFRETHWNLRKPVHGPASYSAALAASNAMIADKQKLARTFPTDWLRGEALARSYQDRFRLTGRYEDLALAAATVAHAQALAPDPGGPVLADAELAMAAHRLPGAEAALAKLQRWAVPPESAERAEAAALTGDIAFYRGDISGARHRYGEAAAIDPAAVMLRLALADKAEGHFDQAIAGFRRFLDQHRAPAPLTVATTAMQVGAVELARGNAAEARRRFQEANTAFPGYWLIEAHLAQAAALAGDPQGAMAQMRRVAEKSQSAEVMDALAMLLRTFGNPAESRRWARRAGAIWERRLSLLPEAAYGHALEHELVFGTPARALALAQRNLAARPFGESRLLLAAALLQNGRTADALGQISAAEKGGWRSAPLYALRAEALALDGREAEAGEARRAAEALNPRIFAPETALVWFSHG